MPKTTLRLFFYLFALAISMLYGVQSSLAQSAYIPYDREYYHKIDRYEILQGGNNPFFNSGYKPYRRDILAQYLDSLAENPEVILSDADQFNLQYLSQDSWEFSQRKLPSSKNPF